MYLMQVETSLSQVMVIFLVNHINIFMQYRRGYIYHPSYQHSLPDSVQQWNLQCSFVFCKSNFILCKTEIFPYYGIGARMSVVLWCKISAMAPTAKIKWNILLFVCFFLWGFRRWSGPPAYSVLHQLIDSVILNEPDPLSYMLIQAASSLFTTVEYFSLAQICTASATLFPRSSVSMINKHWHH